MNDSANNFSSENFDSGLIYISNNLVYSSIRLAIYFLYIIFGVLGKRILSSK